MTIGTYDISIVVTVDFRKRSFDAVEAHVCLLHKILKKCKFDSFLYLSSTRVYANSLSIDENTQILVNPNKFEGIYNISKIMGESLCFASVKPNVHIVILSNVVGNCNNTNDFLSSLIHDAINYKKIILHTTSRSKKDYVYIDDVKILPKILVQSKQKIYNVVSGKNTKVKEITDELKKKTNCEIILNQILKKIHFLK
jgi:nucleoside-diphosphate-sugar epimerase